MNNPPEKLKLKFDDETCNHPLNILRLKKLKFEFVEENVVKCIKAKSCTIQNNCSDIEEIWLQVERANVIRHLYGNYTLISGSCIEYDGTDKIIWTYLIEVFNKDFKMNVIGYSTKGTIPINPRGPASAVGKVEP